MTEEESLKAGYVQGMLHSFTVEEWQLESGPSFGLGFLRQIRVDATYYYRIDQHPGLPTIGNRRHYHIYRDQEQKNQVFAINQDGSFHDGTSYRFNQEWLNALKKLGVEVENIDKKYVA